MDAKCRALLKQQRALLDAHFKQYPWGITYGEFTAYLLDYEIDGSSINDDVGQFPGLKGRYQIALINGLNQKIAPKVAPDVPDVPKLPPRRLNQKIAPKVASKKYFETPPWKDFILTFLSYRFRRTLRGNPTRRLVCGYIHPGTRFFAPNYVQLWARLFLETEENLNALDAFLRGGGLSLMGYNVLKMINSGELDPAKKLRHMSSPNLRYWEEKLSGLSGLGLITITGNQYALSGTATKAFAHMEKYHDTKYDIRRWPYRYDILFPPKNPYFGKPTD